MRECGCWKRLTARRCRYQVAQYHRDGYVCPVPVMPVAEALRLRRQLEAYEATHGIRIRVRGCDQWEFRDGKVIRKDSYWKIVEETT